MDIIPGQYTSPGCYKNVKVADRTEEKKTEAGQSTIRLRGRYSLELRLRQDVHTSNSDYYDDIEQCHAVWMLVTVTIHPGGEVEAALQALFSPGQCNLLQGRPLPL